MNPQAPNTGESTPPSTRHKRPTLPIVFGLLLVVLIAGVFLQLTKHKDEQAVKQANITITKDGMQPDSLLVSKGTQVTWTNTDSSAHQIAADPYPKNDSIPGFNSTNLLQSNDSYSFTFMSPGTYHYHDQLNPLKQLGTVVVR